MVCSPATASMKLTWPKPGYLIIKPFSSTSLHSHEISAIHDQLKYLVSKALDYQILQFYKQLHPSKFYYANTNILPSIIRAASSSPHFHHFGLQLHCITLKTGSDLDPVVSNSLISMYSKTFNTQLAHKVFDTMPQRDTISWNSIINCYCRDGFLFKAIEMVKDMYLGGFVPKPELLASIISLCSRSENLVLAKVIHALVIVDENIDNSVFLLTSLVDLYLKCGESLMALCVFDNMMFKNEVSWTAMISGCVANKNYDLAINCLQEMQAEGIVPNIVTLKSALPAFAKLSRVKQGKVIHGYAVRHGFELYHEFSTALMDMYCKCKGTLNSARTIFEKTKTKDVVMWSSMIASYSRTDDCFEAMKLFGKMREEGVGPNYVTLLAVITASTTKCSLNYGRGVHCYTLKYGLLNSLIGNALINMYSKCGCMASSRSIFEEMAVRDSISWSTLMSAYGIHGYAEEAVNLYCKMKERDIKQDGITFLAVLSACNHAGFVEEGQKLFNEAVKDKLPLTVEHYSCLVDLLGKSGKIDDACDVVSKMGMKPSPQIWSSLISACKTHGRMELVEVLEEKLMKFEPKDASNYALLSSLHAQSGNWGRAEGARKAMRKQGLKKCYGFSSIELAA